MELYNFVNEQVEKRVLSVQNGESEALSNYIELKRIAKALNGAIKEIQSDALSEAERFGKGDFLKDGASVSVRATAGRWDFKQIAEWKKASDEIKKVEDKYKTLYKSKDLGTIPVDEATGEILQMPIFNHGADAIFLKFLK
ncbi:hypothetical protein UFOVP105_3 [uncultured Caudovirales phage]|uniref:Uncharacterized protein n=1 Tax=uncultured Caudovirales phage TaxID=2100421 RepID=A0A6J5L812_9CAUD|nr:hypothetical protein UFOVP105_3 [uncultured Caudovirales phage]